VHSTDRSAAGVTAFNALPDDQAARGLTDCLDATGWAASLLAGRPYPDRESLLATAYRFAVVLEEDDLTSALSAHPRIGERPTGAGLSAAHSRTEQSGVDPADAALEQQLHTGNLAYETKFGHVFLIRAAGRSGPQILEALTERLGNDPATETTVVRDQLAQIAQLRLGAMLDDLGAVSPNGHQPSTQAGP
jgi:2-oxo-4-hydroxy-4-carboxy-5-ureidoimidazoline decarboxylase